MQRPIFVRALSTTEQHELKQGVRSREGFVVRRCQVILASARGERAPAIAHQLGCDDQTVREIIQAFDRSGLSVLQRRSNRPHRITAAFSAADAEQLRHLLHQSPRAFGKARSVWTLGLAAEVSFEQGLTAVHVSGETIRATLRRLGVKWTRAKHWITSPDPAYARKKTHGIA
jgi:transposase